VLFRCDVDEVIGVGHLMRMIALADACAELGMRPIFATPPLAAADAHRLLSRGFEHRAAPPPEEQPRWLAQRSAKALVVDLYDLGERYLQPWQRQKQAPVLQLVDGFSPLPGVRLVLDQNLDATLPPQEQRRDLLGLRYALLRREFCGQTPIDPEAPVERIFVSLGGADPGAHSRQFIGALRAVAEARTLTVVLVVGANNPQRRALKSLSRARPWLEVHENPPDIAALMRSCQLALCAAGSITWELFAIGLPRLLVSTAPNQRPLAAAAQRHGAGIDLGEALTVQPAAITAALSQLLVAADQRRDQAQSGRSLVDGEGARRVAQALMEEINR
jgi:spore coat polysaccharide biosynthesis predicted glycosyltransferase SpsG